MALFPVSRLVSSDSWQMGANTCSVMMTNEHEHSFRTNVFVLNSKHLMAQGVRFSADIIQHN